MNTYEIEAGRLGRRIAALRQHRRWSASTLANAAGITRQYVHDIEAGKRHNVSASVLDSIARSLGWPNFHLMLQSESLEPPDPTAPVLTVVDPDALAAEIAARVTPEVTAAVVKQLTEELRTGRLRLPGGVSSSRPGLPGIGGSPYGSSGGNGRGAARHRPARPLFRYGAAGDPIDAADLPDVVDEREPPEEFADELGTECFGVVIQGTSLVGLGIRDGDVVWCRPQEHARLLETVAAVVAGEDDSEAKKLVVKQYRQGAGLPPGLWSAMEGQNPEPTGWHEFHIRGQVVCVEPAAHAFRPALVAPRAHTNGSAA